LGIKQNACQLLERPDLAAKRDYLVQCRQDNAKREKQIVAKPTMIFGFGALGWPAGRDRF
jgi:hypothetical protein